MNWFAFIITPIIGAIIGYATNYIAVKLLFRPLKPVYIGKFHVPFTPGIIPKRKKHLAKAIGDAVGQKLLTPGDMESALRSDAVKETICNEIMVELVKVKNYNTLGALVSDVTGKERFYYMRRKIEEIALDKIISGLKRIDFEAMLLADGGAAIKEKMKGSFLGLFVSEDTIRSVARPLVGQINSFIDEKGPSVIRPIIREEIDKLQRTNTGELLDHLGIDEENTRAFIIRIYETLVLNKIADIIRRLDFAGMVERKVAEMDVLEIEFLLLSVMKKELNSVINLGAYIGFFLGLFNSFLLFL